MQRRARDGREIIYANYITDGIYGTSTRGKSYSHHVVMILIDYSSIQDVVYIHDLLSLKQHGFCWNLVECFILIEGDVFSVFMAPFLLSTDAGVRRYIKKENGVNSSKDRISKASMPAARKTEDASKEFAAEFARYNPSHASRITNVNKLAKVSTVPPNHHRDLDPGPTPAPTPTFARGTRFKDKIFISRPNELVTSVTSVSPSGVYSSSSDPVLVPALNPRNPGTVGTIKREIGSQRTATDSIVSPANEGRLDAPQNPHADSRTINYINTTGPKESRGVSDTATQPVAINHERQHSKQVKSHSGGTTSIYIDSPLIHFYLFWISEFKGATVINVDGFLMFILVAQCQRPKYYC